MNSQIEIATIGLDMHEMVEVVRRRQITAMFHWQNNIFFGRRTDGSVRILVFNAPPEDWPDVEGKHDALFDETISVDSWASIVASVSAGNEIDNRFYAAKDFHKSVGPVQIVFDRR